MWPSGMSCVGHNARPAWSAGSASTRTEAAAAYYGYNDDRQDDEQHESSHCKTRSETDIHRGCLGGLQVREISFRRPIAISLTAVVFVGSVVTVVRSVTDVVIRHAVTVPAVVVAARTGG